MKQNVIIVGAGPAGLATAAALKHEGIDSLVLEQSSELVTSWKTHYDRLKLNSVKWFSALPYLAMPSDYPVYPTRQQFVDYLDSYASKFDIKPVFNSKVTSVVKGESGWKVNTENNLYQCEHLVIATSSNQTPYIPDIEGLNTFSGQVLHSKQYRNAAPFAGKSVLVVGSGNSGAEIAVDLAENGAKSTLVIRSPVHVSPLNLFGVVPAQITSILLNFLPLSIADRIASLTLRMVVGNLAKYGIRTPELGPLKTLVEKSRVAIFDSGIVKLIKSGKIDVTPRITGIQQLNIVKFSDGRLLQFDHIIFATGFHNNLSELFENSADYIAADGLPKVCGKDAGSHVYFVGFRESPRGMLNDIRSHAMLIAKEIAQ